MSDMRNSPEANGQPLPPRIRALSTLHITGLVGGLLIAAAGVFGVRGGFQVGPVTRSGDEPPRWRSDDEATAGIDPDSRRPFSRSGRADVPLPGSGRG